MSDVDCVFLTFLSFVITASDGVWEFITSGEAVDIVQKSLSGGADCDAGTALYCTALYCILSHEVLLHLNVRLSISMIILFSLGFPF